MVFDNNMVKAAYEGEANSIYCERQLDLDEGDLLKHYLYPLIGDHKNVE